MAGTLWTDGDSMTEARRNREAIATRFSLPTYDIEQGGAVTLAPSRVVGTALPSTIAALYGVPTGITVTWVDSITLVNMHTASLAVTLYIVESAGSVGVARQIYAGTLLPNFPVELVGPWFLYEDAWIGGFAASANKVAFTADLMEFTYQPAGLRLVEVPPAVLTTDEVEHYAVPGSGCEHALLLATTICNTDTSARTPTIYRSQVVSPVSTPEAIWSSAMAPKETALFPARPKILLPGDILVGKASANSVVSVRHTILEVA